MVWLQFCLVITMEPHADVFLPGLDSITLNRASLLAGVMTIERDSSESCSYTVARQMLGITHLPSLMTSPTTVRKRRVPWPSASQLVAQAVSSRGLA